MERLKNYKTILSGLFMNKEKLLVTAKIIEAINVAEGGAPIIMVNSAASLSFNSMVGCNHAKCSERAAAENTDVIAHAKVLIEGAEHLLRQKGSYDQEIEKKVREEASDVFRELEPTEVVV